jgi:hypothetical protein
MLAPTRVEYLEDGASLERDQFVMAHVTLECSKDPIGIFGQEVDEVVPPVPGSHYTIHRGAIDTNRIELGQLLEE